MNAGAQNIRDRFDASPDRTGIEQPNVGVRSNRGARGDLAPRHAPDAGHLKAFQVEERRMHEDPESVRAGKDEQQTEEPERSQALAGRWTGTALRARGFT